MSTSSTKKLKGFQRKYLRGLAHDLKPIVQVGQSGVTEQVIEAAKEALLQHELIKVGMTRPTDKKGMAEALAVGTRSELCGLVGHIAILYKRHPEEPAISLPKA